MMKMFHVSTPERTNSIIDQGLRVNAYLTCDWIELLQGHFIPELTAPPRSELSIFEVDVFGLTLEYDPENREDPEFMMICLDHIAPDRVTHLGNASKVGKGFTARWEILS